MKKHLNLKQQVVMIFSAVAIITALVFLVVLESQTRSMLIKQDRIEQERYLDNVLFNIGIDNVDLSNGHYGYILVVDGVIVKSENLRIMGNSYTNEKLLEIVNLSQYIFHINEPGNDNIYLHGKTRTISGRQYRVLSLSNGSYQREYRLETTFSVRFAFISIILLGNVIIVLWATLLVDRINMLKKEVGNLSETNFKKPIRIDGQDEIGDLSRAIEMMRISIEKSAETKNEMLQNVSHDIKTPIAVIKSYAEAIYDGVSDIKDIQVIIKQADLLNRKVRQLLEFNKLEHIKDQSDYQDILLRPLIESIIEQNKYRTSAQFVFSFDDSSYFGVYENFQIVFSNLIDNAIRYAKNVIKVTVKDKKVTIFNDGEPIDEKFVNSEGFNPYEKGTKGQFGLGLSIVYKTLTHFNLTIDVKNIDNGVLFTIKPLV